MSFKEYYIKKELHDSDRPLSVGNLGILDNLNMQWEVNCKAAGIVSRKDYYFGYTDDYTLDHTGIISELMGMIEDPTLMLFIQGHIDYVEVNIHPVHTSRSKKITSDFEYDIIRHILLECKVAFGKVPENQKLRVDISDVFLDTDDSKCTRAENEVELDHMLVHLYKPIKETEGKETMQKKEKGSTIDAKSRLFIKLAVPLMICILAVICLYLVRLSQGNTKFPFAAILTPLLGLIALIGLTFNNKDNR